jgi:hypothetical protein
MTINDRFWRLVVIFWPASAVALILSLASAPLLHEAVSDGSARSAVAEPAAVEFSFASGASIQPTATARLIKDIATGHSHVRYIHKSNVTPSSTKAKMVTPSKAPIVIAEVASQATNPPGEVLSSMVVEPARTSFTDAVGKQVSDGVPSAQKWLVNETGINAHGLVNIGTNYNFNQPATGNNTYRVFDYFGASSFEPNQAELYLNRSVSNQPGFVIDLNFWNTAEVMHGLTSYYGDQLGSHNPTGWMDPTQVYLTYTIPIGKGINLSAGRQVSLIGFEYIPSWNNINFNQSIDLLYSLGEPFTVTGVRATYPFTDHLSATFGVNNGWDTIANTNLFQTLEGQVSLMSNKSLTWNLQGGRSCRNDQLFLSIPKQSRREA